MLWCKSVTVIRLPFLVTSKSSTVVITVEQWLVVTTPTPFVWPRSRRLFLAFTSIIHYTSRRHHSRSSLAIEGVVGVSRDDGLCWWRLMVLDGHCSWCRRRRQTYLTPAFCLNRLLTCGILAAVQTATDIHITFYTSMQAKLSTYGTTTGCTARESGKQSFSFSFIKLLLTYLLTYHIWNSKQFDPWNVKCWNIWLLCSIYAVVFTEMHKSWLVGV